MKAVIFIGSARSALPDAKDVPPKLVGDADLLITMNRPCTFAAIVKNRHGDTGLVDVVYGAEAT